MFDYQNSKFQCYNFKSRIILSILYFETMTTLGKFNLLNLHNYYTSLDENIHCLICAWDKLATPRINGTCEKWAYTFFPQKKKAPP